MPGVYVYVPHPAVVAAGQRQREEREADAVPLGEGLVVPPDPSDVLALPGGDVRVVVVGLGWVMLLVLRLRQLQPLPAGCISSRWIGCGRRRCGRERRRAIAAAPLHLPHHRSSACGGGVCGGQRGELERWRQRCAALGCICVVCVADSRRRQQASAEAYSLKN